MQKIMSALAFSDQAEPALNFYSSLFAKSSIDGLVRFGDSGPGPAGTVLTVTGKLCGQDYLFINGGPSYFKFSPAVSLVVKCATEAEIDAIWARLSDGGKALMPLDRYPFSEKFGWLTDKFGVSWQLNLTNTEQQIVPLMMFVGDRHGRAEEAIEFYVSNFPGSGVGPIHRYAAGEGDTEGTIKQATFNLAGQEFKAMDSGYAHAFTFEQGISFLVNCESQAEIDRLWDSLSAGGQTQQCGWLKDKFGVSWQIVPAVMHELTANPESLDRFMKAMMKMTKLDLATLVDAAAS